MPLSPGTRLGPYEIVGPLGAGGMGEVYRARDERLDREVAVKVLPGELARQPERLRRFEQEARASSALNHPCIVTVFDVGETDGVSWVAMELVDGETLEERIERGPLAIGKALEISAAIADGLAAAHDAGVVHRDLKPSNVMVAREGFVKILDFGLAKVVGEAAPDAAGSDLQTQTSPGSLIGTAAYMSPEQAAGSTADARADQFALGLILYELLAGRPALRRETAAETLTAILREDPEPLPRLRPDVPVPLAWIVERCLSKEPADRYAATTDLARDLRQLVGRLSDLSLAPTAGRGARKGRAARVPWLLAAGLAIVASAAILWPRGGAEPADVVHRLTVTLPEGHLVSTDYWPAVAISPDGSRIVYAGRDPDGVRHLYARPLDELESSPVPGTEGGSGPFFSPDGEWIGFVAYGKLKKIPVHGGAPITLADAPNARGATWLDDDTIVFAPTFSSGLHRVAASGGTVSRISTPDPSVGEYSHRWPQWLPDGQTLVFVIWTRAPHFYERPSIGLFDLQSGDRRSLIEDGEYAVYSPSGHLIYTRQGRLHIVGFDVDRLALQGEPRSLTDVALVDHNTHAGHFAISHEGTLAYVPGSLTSERTLVWVDREGNETPIDAPPRAYLGVRLSPDGRRIATTIEGETPDVWIFDLESSALRRLTSEGSNGYAIWTPDGRHLTFSSDHPDGMRIVRMRADGTGGVDLVAEGGSTAVPGSWSPDASHLAFTVWGEDDLGGDLAIAPWAEGGDVYRYEATAADERWAKFSPDGRWIAFSTNAAGLDQIQVGPFPGPGPLSQVSVSGGRDPLWSADGRKLYFRNADEVWEVDFDGEGGEARAGRPRRLFERRYRRPPGPLPNYDLGPDGRFLMIKGGDAPGRLDHLHVVSDWSAEIPS